jgi:nitrous oxidase accessory protein
MTGVSSVTAQGAPTTARLVVSPQGPFTTIVDALQVAQPHDTIEVQGGVYPAPLVIDKTVTVRGVGNPVIDGRGDGSLVIINAPDVVFMGFRLRGTGTSLVKEDTALVIQAAGVTVADNVMDDVLFGIYFAAAPNGIARNNMIYGKPINENMRGDGIRVWYSNDVTLDGNFITATRDVLIWYADNIIIRNNRLDGNRYGLHFMYNKNATVIDNVIENNLVGAYMMYSANLVLRDNKIVNNRGASGYALALKDMDAASVTDNTFANNRVGVYFDNSPSLYDVYNEFSRNLFAHNDIGVTALPAVKRNIFRDNIFLDNAQQASTEGRGTLQGNLWSQDGRGNYWSDYGGYDQDADGIGDLPYRSEKLFDSLADTRPVLRLFAFSPATQALNFAAAAFPSLRPDPKLIDTAPLMRYDLPANVSAGASPSPLPLVAWSCLLLLLGGMVGLVARSAFPRHPGTPAI